MRSSRSLYLAGLLACWIASRLLYLLHSRVRFNSSPLTFYLQYIDPQLLKTDLWRSTYYLNSQPPAFNWLLGLVLKILGRHADVAFQFIFLACGVALCLVLFSLLWRLGVPPVIAFVVTIVFTANPISALYENWLFYTYPLVLLIALSAFFLHRYVSGNRTLDALLFFTVTAVIILVRGTYHPLWIALLFVAFLWAWPTRRRQLIAAAAVPCLLVAAVYCKNYVVFGKMFSGEVFQETNFGMMIFEHLSPSANQKLLNERRISGLALLSPYYWFETDRYRRFLPPVKRWGVRVLDDVLKSTGAPNWNSQVMTELSRLYYLDAKNAARDYPGSYARAVISNIPGYFLPADEVWPFPDANAMKLERPLRLWHAVITGQISGTASPPWLNYVTFPACVLFGCWYLLMLRKGGSSNLRLFDNANALTIMFMLYTIVYTAAVTLLFSVGDHNRYRCEVSAFYAALFAMLLSTISRARFLSRRHEPRWK
ncbi:MAG: glycosyltransferase family 39 protein [Acidobacteriaceae bacterium]|nr:glycosyltransferase family 39 protein [Acidobacteriaceae bacterium]